jgi:hypothetical protein
VLQSQRLGRRAPSPVAAPASPRYGPQARTEAPRLGFHFSVGSLLVSDLLCSLLCYCLALRADTRFAHGSHGGAVLPQDRGAAIFQIKKEGGRRNLLGADAALD